MKRIRLGEVAVQLRIAKVAAVIVLVVALVWIFANIEQIDNINATTGLPYGWERIIDPEADVLCYLFDGGGGHVSIACLPIRARDEFPR